MKPILHEDYPWLDWVFGVAILGAASVWAVNKYDVPIPFISDNTDLVFARDSFPAYGIALNKNIQSQLDSQEITYAFSEVEDQSKRLDFTQSKHNFALTTLDKAFEYGKGGVIIGLFDVTKGGDCVVTSREIGGSFKALSKSDPVVAYTAQSPSSYLWERTRTLAGISDGSGNNKALDNPDQVWSALESREADAAVLWQPYCAEATAYNTLFSTQQDRGSILDVLMVSEEFLAEEPEQVQIYMNYLYGSIFDYVKEDNFTALNEAIGGEVFSDMRVKLFNPIVVDDWLNGGNLNTTIANTIKITGNENNIKFNDRFLKKAIEPHVRKYRGTLSDFQKAELRLLRESPKAQPLRIDYSNYKKVTTLSANNLTNLINKLDNGDYPLGSYIFKLVQTHPDTRLGREQANYKIITLHDNKILNPIDQEILVGPQNSVLEIYQDIGDQ